MLRFERDVHAYAPKCTESVCRLTGNRRRQSRTQPRLAETANLCFTITALPRFLPADSMNDVTLLFQRLQKGDSVAADELAPLVYAELRRIAAAKMARERPGQTLQATSLVHEAWLRLGDGVFSNRAHFFAAAAEAMRRILVERARRKSREKRGGGDAEHVDIDEVEIAAPEGNEEETLAVHEALEHLAARDARQAEIVKLRYFVGFSFEETAEVLGISSRTAKREWAYARAQLFRDIRARQAPLQDGRNFSPGAQK